MKASDNQTVDEIEQLKALVSEQQAKLSALSHENTWLKEQLGLARLARFGTSSEKPPTQDDFFNEAETCDEEPDDEAETATLLGYLADGRLEIDNNRAERDIRSFTTGRKNWLFSNTPRGARSSAILYSLVMTARANHVNPYHYLRTILTRLPNLSANDSLDELLPWNMTLS